jgi:exodeoxyribonuclease V alpha subunit
MILKKLNNIGILNDIDINFAEFMLELSKGKGGDALLLAAALTSNASGNEKHVCLDLSLCAKKSIAEVCPEANQEKEFRNIFCPSLEEWIKELKQAPVVGNPGNYAPLILDSKNRLYLARYWKYENNLANFIKNRSLNDSELIDFAILKEGLEKYFPKDKSNKVNWQKAAAFSALTNKFCVISGGPGTGKTSTVAKIIALLLEQRKGKRTEITLTTPTGKAAARLQESITNAKSALPCADEIKAKMPEKALTVHRLLGYIHGSPEFRHNKDNPLASDVIIVDEASMLPLALMSKLFDAAPEKAKIILLGDKDQLASVEAGAVLNDICEASEPDEFPKQFSEKYFALTAEKISNKTTKNPLAANSTILKHSYRFDSASGIGLLSKAVNEGDSEKALQTAKDNGGDAVSFLPLPKGGHFRKELEKIAEKYFIPAMKADNINEAFKFFNSFKILAACREGNCGVKEINSIIEDILKKRGFIKQDESFYKGRPVMISKNDYSSGLFNGDIGLLWRSGNGVLRAFFPDSENGFREIAPGALPQHETVFAMTTHKSQGSEFDKILLVLPEKDSQVITRELLYTAITRSRKSVEIWASEDVFKAAVKKRASRRSGLKDALAS